MLNRNVSILFIILLILYMIAIMAPVLYLGLFKSDGSISILSVIMLILIIVAAIASVRNMVLLYKNEGRITLKVSVRFVVFFLLIPVIYATTFIISILLQDGVYYYID